MHTIVASWMQHMLPPHCRTVVLCLWTVQGRTFPAASLQWTSPLAPPVKYALHVTSLLQQRACVCLDHTSISTGTACTCFIPKATLVSYVHLAEGKLDLGGIQLVPLACASCSASVTVLLVPNAAQNPGQLCTAGIKLTSGAGASSSALISPISLSANLIISA